MQETTTFPEYALRSYIEATRGALHPMGSLAEAYADDVAHALTPIGATVDPFDTRMAHGPTVDPRGIDCGCGWGYLCDAVRDDSETPRTLCGAQLERGAAREYVRAIARYSAWLRAGRQRDDATFALLMRCDDSSAK